MVDDSPYEWYRARVVVEFDLDIQSQNDQQAFQQAQTITRDVFVNQFERAEAVVIKIDHAMRAIDKPSFKF